MVRGMLQIDLQKERTKLLHSNINPMKINKHLVQQFQNTLNNALKDQPESQNIEELNEIIVNSLT